MGNEDKPWTMFSEDIILYRMFQFDDFEELGDISRMTDESEVDHQIECHADTLPQSYRILADKTRRLLAALQVIQDEKNKHDYLKLLIDRLKLSPDDSFPNVVQSALENLKLNDDDICIEFDISQASLNRWKAGKCSTHPDLRKHIYSYFEVKAQEQLKPPII